MRRRVAIIGDVAGFLPQLRSCLQRLGVTDDSWPSGLHVVQLGDLFGGNDDLACAQLVEPHLRAGRWTQLIGNWELAAVGGPRVSRGGVSARSDALRVFSRWCGDGLVEYAAVVRGDEGPPALVTHAGLTSTWWTDHLGAEQDIDAVAGRINAAHHQHLHFGGEMAGDVGVPASPVWASTRELWTGWSSVAPPWSQIHGHTSAFDPGCGWSPWVPTDLTDRCAVDPQTLHTTFAPAADGHVIHGIDAGLWTGSRPDALHALCVRGASRPGVARRPAISAGVGANGHSEQAINP